MAFTPTTIQATTATLRQCGRERPPHRSLFSKSTTSLADRPAASRHDARRDDCATSDLSENEYRTDSWDGSAPHPSRSIDTTPTSETCPPGRSAQSQAVAYSRGLACVRLPHHSATAEQ